jgi:hypothetical protein
MHYKSTFFEKILLISSILLISFGYSNAKPNGITGLTSSTSKGCNCHSSSKNTDVVLSLTSSTGSFTVEPNSTTTFTITINKTSAVVSGIDIAVKSSLTDETNVGTLSAINGEGLKLSNGELVHSSPKKMSNGNVSFSFKWTAPSQEGTYYLRAISLAANGDGKENSADVWNWLTPQIINVQKSSSVSETGTDAVKIMPNPFKDNVFIDLSSYSQHNISNLEIIDQLGNEIKTFDKNSTQIIWDCHDNAGKGISKGFYYLVIEFKNSRKLIPLINY